jgi:hypothetical protein
LPELKFKNESKISSMVVSDNEELDENGDPIEQKSVISKIPMHPEKEIK